MIFEVGDVVRRRRGVVQATVLIDGLRETRVRWINTGRSEWIAKEDLRLVHRKLEQQQRKLPIMNFDLKNDKLVPFGDLPEDVQDALKKAFKMGRLKYFSKLGGYWKNSRNPSWNPRAMYGSDAVIERPFVHQVVQNATLTNEQRVPWGNLPGHMQQQFYNNFWLGWEVQTLKGENWEQLKELDPKDLRQVLRVVGGVKQDNAPVAPLPEPVQVLPEDSIDWAAVSEGYNYLVRLREGHPLLVGEKPVLNVQGQYWAGAKGFVTAQTHASYKNNGRPWQESLVCRPGFED